jgi:hypothetical protein
MKELRPMPLENLTNEELEKLDKMTITQLANILDDGLLHSGTLNESLSVLEFIKHYL